MLERVIGNAPDALSFGRFRASHYTGLEINSVQVPAHLRKLRSMKSFFIGRTGADCWGLWLFFVCIAILQLPSALAR